MSKQELANSLRALADKVEGLPEGLAVMVEFRAYRVDQLAHLREMAALMEVPASNSNNGTHWLKGFHGPIEVTAFYCAGLLGTKKQEVVRYVVSEETDLSLLAVPANVG